MKERSWKHSHTVAGAEQLCRTGQQDVGSQGQKDLRSLWGYGAFLPWSEDYAYWHPVRQQLLDSNISHDDAVRSFGFDPQKKTVLIVGGSLGARTLNESVLSHLEDIKESGVQFVWQTGKYYSAEIAERMKGHDIPNLKITDYDLHIEQDTYEVTKRTP